MKDSKRIDNKMRAKKLAAYTLATCMTVTVAPVGAVTPVMAEQVESHILGAADVAIPTTAIFDIENSITVGMMYKDAINKIVLKDTASENPMGNLVSNKITIKDTDGNAVYTSTVGTNGTNKLEVGKKYTIEAEFDLSGYTVSDGGIRVKDNKGTLVGTAASTKLALAGYTVDLTNSSTTAKLDDYPDGLGKFYYRNGKGELVKTETVAQNKDGWFYVKDGTIVTSVTDPTVVSNAYGKWVITGATGEVDTSYEGLATDSDSVVWYAKKGQVQDKVTDVLCPQNDETNTATTDLYNIVNGKVAKKETIAQNKTDGKWYYIDDTGKEDNTYNGLCANENGKWLVVGGIVKFSKDDTGFITDSDRKIASTIKTYYVENSKINTAKTGVVYAPTWNSVSSDFTGAAKLYNVKNGIVDDTVAVKETVAQDPNSGKWYAIDATGAIDTSATLAKNDYGIWVVDDNGEVVFEAEGLITDVGGVVSTDATKIYYVKNGKVDTSMTGFVDYATGTIDGIASGSVAADTGVNGKFYVEKGVVTGKEFEESVVHDPKTGNWYYVDEDGEVTGAADTKLAANKNGLWYINNGKVDFKAEARTTCVAGLDITSVYYVKDGKAQTNKTGWTQIIGTEATPLYVVDGIVDKPAKTTVSQAPDGKWYVEDADTAGGYNAFFDGIVVNNYGTWYAENGLVSFDYTGVVVDTDKVLSKDATKEYSFVKSALDKKATGVMLDATGSHLVNFENGAITGKKPTDCVVHCADDGKWYKIGTDGKVDKTAGLAANAYGLWMIEGTNGSVDFDYEGFRTVTTADLSTGKVKSGQIVYINGGKVQSDFTGVVTAPVDGGAPATYNVKNGVVTTVGVDDIVQAADGDWYFVKNGQVDTTFTGLKSNANGTYYLENGKVNFNKTGIVNAAPGAATDEFEQDTEYYVVKGQMKSDTTGVVSVGSTKYYVEKNKLITGLAKEECVVNGMDGKWYAIGADGSVITSGSSQFYGNASGAWFVKADGTVDFTKNGIVELDGSAGDDVLAFTDANGKVVRKALEYASDKQQVYVVNGAVSFATTGVVKVDNKYYNIVDGYDEEFGDSDVHIAKGTDNIYYAMKDAGTKGTELSTTAGLAIYEKEDGTTELWYVGDDGKFVATMTGIISDGNDSSKKKYVVDGKFQDTVTGIVDDVLTTNKYYVQAGVVYTGIATTYTDSNSKVWNVSSTGVATE